MIKGFFLRLYDVLQRRRWLFFAVVALLCGLMALAALRLEVESDVARLMKGDAGNEKIYEVLFQSRFADKIAVKVSSSNNTSIDSLIVVADTLKEMLLRNYGGYIGSIKSEISDEQTREVYRLLLQNLPLFLAEEDYNHIDSLVQPDAIRNAVERDYRMLTSPQGMILKEILARDPLGISTPLTLKLQALQADNRMDLYDSHLVSADGQGVYLFITGAYRGGEIDKNEVLVDGLYELSESIKRDNPSVNIYYYGSPVAGVSNARQVKRDTAITLSLTILILLSLLFIVFRSKKVPFIMLLPVGFGVLFALAVISITKGSISGIALGAGSIVLAIAANYSLHFFIHYRHCKSVKQTLDDLFQPLTIGSFTTIGAFISLTFIASPILNDFGLFSSLSLAGAILFTLVVLPHLMPAVNEDASSSRIEDIIARISFPKRYSAIAVVVILLITLVLLPRAFDVNFDSDMSNLNFLDAHTKESETEINKLQGDSSKQVFIAAMGKDMQQCLESSEILNKKLDKLVQEGKINKYTAIGKFLPSQKVQQKRLNLWKAYWTTAKQDSVLKNLDQAAATYGFSSTAFQQFRESLSKDYSVADTAVASTLVNVLGQEYVVEMEGGNVALISVADIEKSKRSDVYAELASPEIAVLDKQIITDNLAALLYNDFNSVLLYTSLLVFIALLFTYGRLELTLLTFLPMLISWIWILGLLSVFHIKFNLINIVISTFVFGLGDDFSIFTTDGLTRRFRDGKNVLAVHKFSIFFSAVVTLVGMGMLIFAKHPALHSIALISVVGILCVTFISQTVQPFLYNFFIQSRKEKGRAPWTLATLALAIFAFSYFVIGAFIITIPGAVWLYLIPFPDKKRRKYVFHFILSMYLGSLVYIMANVRKRHINKHLADFAKPSIIIANHSSFLDILVTVMQHPKLILLTNKWTYNSPVFGTVIRMADYYPVPEGVDPAVDKLQAVVKDGYSIVVFPEGTRSPDGRMRRFHKGAFYLAEKFQLDIQPLLLHGIGNTMGKGDFMLFNGTMTMKYLPRIKADDVSFGTGYVERTKNISRYFKSEFEKLRQEIEPPTYFKQKLVSNYNYKGPQLELAVRFEPAKENYYSDYLHALPKEAEKITVLGSGWGFMSYMIAFSGPDRIITGIDIDEEKVAVANNCYSKTENIQFHCADVRSYNFENKQDAIILDIAVEDLSQMDWERLLQRAVSSLSYKGVILLKPGQAAVCNEILIKKHQMELRSSVAPGLIILQKSYEQV